MEINRVTLVHKCHKQKKNWAIFCVLHSDLSFESWYFSLKYLQKRIFLVVFIITVKSRADLQGSEMQLKRIINKWREVCFLDSMESALQRGFLKAPWKVYFPLCKRNFILRKKQLLVIYYLDTWKSKKKPKNISSMLSYGNNWDLLFSRKKNHRVFSYLQW